MTTTTMMMMTTMSRACHQESQRSGWAVSARKDLAIDGVEVRAALHAKQVESCCTSLVSWHDHQCIIIPLQQPAHTQAILAT